MVQAEDILDAALKLEPAERARIAHEIIVSLDGEPADEGVEEAWEQELAKRAAEIDSAPWSLSRGRRSGRISSTLSADADRFFLHPTASRALRLATAFSCERDRDIAADPSEPNFLECWCSVRRPRHGIEADTGGS